MKRFIIILKFFFKLIFKIKIKNEIEKKKIIVFDCVNSYHLISILEAKDYFLLSSRLNRINTIFLDKDIITYIIKNFFKRNLKINYFISLIQKIDPNVVITNIDNSVEFTILSKHFFEKKKFLSIQFGTRGDIFRNSGENNHLLFFSNLICFGEFDIELLKKKKVIVKKYFLGGSLKNSYYQNKFKGNDKLKKIDICFMGKQMSTENKKLEKIFLNQKKILEFLIKFVENKKLNFLIQSKQIKNNFEEKFYKKLIGRKKIKINWRKNKFDFSSSYDAINTSKIVIGPPSTILREALSHNAKVLCCEISPESEGIHPFDGFCYLENFNYQQFEKRLNHFLDINTENYYKKLNRKLDYYMKKENTSLLIKKLISKENYLLK